MKSKLSPIGTYNAKQILSLFNLEIEYGIEVVTSIGNLDLPSLQQPSRSDHFVIFIAKGGEMNIKLNLTDYTLRKNTILLLSPQVVRQILNVSSDFLITTVVFSSDFLSASGLHKKQTDAFEFLSPMTSPLIAVEESEVELLLQMANVLSIKLRDKENLTYKKDILLQVFGGFFLILSSIYNKHRSQSKLEGTRKEELTYRFLKLLPQHFQQHRTLKFYADGLYVTPKYLSKTVKTVTGKSAAVFINDIVILEAKILLRNLDLSISQIANILNFSDQFYFCKYFKAQCNITPSKFRKELL